MALEFTIDLTGDTPETIEAGTQTPPGWYHARLEDIYDDEKTAGVVVFKYKVLSGNGGAWTGRYVFDRVGDPDAAEGENAADFIRRRIKLLAKRLGLLDDERIKAGGQAELTWYAALNKEVVLNVKRRSYDEKDRATGQKTGNRREIVGVDFAGVYPIGYPLDKLPKDCPTDMRRLISATGSADTGPATTAAPAPHRPAAAAGATPPAAAPRAQANAFDFSDL
jgi:hypothetical protein